MSRIRKAVLLIASVAAMAAFAAPAAQASEWVVNGEPIGSEPTSFTAQGEMVGHFNGSVIETNCQETMIGSIWNEEGEARGVITGFDLTVQAPLKCAGTYNGYVTGQEANNSELLEELGPEAPWPLAIDGTEIAIQDFSIRQIATYSDPFHYLPAHGTAALTWNGGFEFNEAGGGSLTGTMGEPVWLAGQLEVVSPEAVELW